MSIFPLSLRFSLSTHSTMPSLHRLILGSLLTLCAVTNVNAQAVTLGAACSPDVDIFGCQGTNYMTCDPTSSKWLNPSYTTPHLLTLTKNIITRTLDLPKRLPNRLPPSPLLRRKLRSKFSRCRIPSEFLPPILLHRPPFLNS